MTATEKCETLKYIISRYDHYYDSVNNKGNVYLTVNLFILGSVIASYYTLSSSWVLNNASHITAVILIILNLTSVYYTLTAIRPHLNTKNDNHTGSLIYFGDVADYHKGQHIERWDNLAIDGLYNDLRTQVHLLAAGLSMKFQNLRKATLFISLQILAAVVLYCIIFLTK